MRDTSGLRDRPVGFLFPGQGAQFPGMATGLYGEDAVFTPVMDQVFDYFGQHGSAVRDLWLSGRSDDGFDDVSVAQPLLYGVNCGVAAALIAQGVTPSVVIGHSVGELAAATVAGVLDLDAGLAWVSRLIEWCRHVPAGGMLAVASSADDVESYLCGDVVVGALNGARQVLLAGPSPELESVQRALVADGVTCFRARARQPFHSPVMSAAAPAGHGRYLRKPLRRPRVVLYSCYVGDVLTDELACDPSFWEEQPARPVLFAPTIERLLAAQPLNLIEVGPGASLTTLVRRLAGVARGRSTVTATLPGSDPDLHMEALASVADRFANTSAPRSCLSS